MELEDINKTLFYLLLTPFEILKSGGKLEDVEKLKVSVATWLGAIFRSTVEKHLSEEEFQEFVQKLEKIKKAGKIMYEELTSEAEDIVRAVVDAVIHESRIQILQIRDFREDELPDEVVMEYEMADAEKLDEELNKVEEE